MKTIPTIVMTFALALSLPACTTTTSHPAAVKSSVIIGNPAVVLRHPFHQLERDGAPKPIPVGTDSEVPTVESVDEGVSVMESDSNTPSSTNDTVLSILGQIAVACATSGNCW